MDAYNYHHRPFLIRCTHNLCMMAWKTRMRSNSKARLAFLHLWQFVGLKGYKFNDSFYSSLDF